MPQAKLLSSSYFNEVRCAINYKTQEIASVCDPFSISKLVQKKSQQSQQGELAISVDLKTAALKQISEKKMMSPVIEKAEEELFETEKGDENKKDESEKNDVDFELEPPRYGFVAVRRRSKQFYDVNEFHSDKGTEDQRTVPVFNVGKSFKNMYQDEKEDETSNEDSVDTPTPTIPVDYDSDSGLLKKVQPYKPLRKIQSLPEIHRGNYSWDSDGMVSGQSTSFTDLSRNWKQQTMELQRGPGYSFLASVADNLIGMQTKKVGMRADTNLVQDKGNSPAEVDQRGREVTTEVKNRPVVTTEPAQVAVAETPEKKRSIFKSVQEWGTKKQTPVTKREMNMYMPTSF